MHILLRNVSSQRNRGKIIVMHNTNVVIVLLYSLKTKNNAIINA